MNVKRILAFLISFAMLIGAFSINVFAEKALYTTLNKNEVLYSNDCFSVASEDEEIDYQALRSYFFECIKNCQTEIVISKFNIPTAYAQKVADLLWNEMPEAFHLSDSMDVYSLIDRDILYSLKLGDYMCTKAQYASMYAEFENATDNMVKDLKSDKISDLKKALILHDRLALCCEYDESVNEGNESYKTYTAYGAVVEGIAVCQGYAEAYDYLLEKVGIYSVLCASEALYHVWNIIEINGKLYHVDTTWDDPVFDNPSYKPKDYVSHKNFLLSSYQLYYNGNFSHKANDFNTAPYDNTFDNYFWRNITTPFTLLGDGVYYKNTFGYLCDLDEQKSLVSAGLGDINGDRKINAVDISNCRSIVTSAATPDNAQAKACDINKDGILDVADLVRLKRILLYI